jgi:hypothetical protein
MFFSNLTELTMGQGYRRFFRFVPALSDALRSENYRIRHEVYCRDPGFERIGDDVHHRGVHFPSLMSVDEVIGGMNFLVRALFEILSREIKEGIELAGRHAVRANHSPLP